MRGLEDMYGMGASPGKRVGVTRKCETRAKRGHLSLEPPELVNQNRPREYAGSERASLPWDWVSIQWG